MRSKFAIWSDQQGILSPKPRSTFAWVRKTIVVCSICGIAGAGVYSQIGPDRATIATDRPSGYGTEERVAEQLRAQASVGRSTAVDGYARSGATTGAASPAPTAIGPMPQAPAGAPSSAPAGTPSSVRTPLAATPESAPESKPARGTASASTRAAPEPAKPPRRMDDQDRQATSTTAEDSPDRTPQRRRSSSAADPASRGNSGKDSVRSAATKSAPQEPAQSSSEQGDTATPTTAGANLEAKTSRFDEKSRGTRRYARNGSRDRRDAMPEPPQGWWAQEGAGFEPQDRRSYPEYSTRDRRGRGGYPDFDSRERRGGAAYAEFESRDRRSRDAEYEMVPMRRTPSRSWPFNLFGMPF